uniref:Pentatricopeptide repeat-containing protein n=1 Tax=Cucumis melo TaxID=3656 RepID=A0A9I9CNQ7_CUCME
MFVNVRRLQNSFKVHWSSSLSSSQTLIPKFFNEYYYSSDSSTRSFDYIAQFLPSNDGTLKLISVNSVTTNDRRRVSVGLSKAVKLPQGYVLKGLSRNFCPFLLVKIMKLFECRETAFAFFKLAFKDDSEETVKSCCVLAHLLAAEQLRFLAQDIVSWVVARIGPGRSKNLAAFMWEGHRMYESDFSVLNTLMRAFMKSEMHFEALEILSKMREVGVTPNPSAISILFRLLIRAGDCGAVWKLFGDVVRKGPCPNNFIFNLLILEFCRKGWTRIGEALLHVMGKFRCEPDVYSYNIVIHANCLKGQSSYALHLVNLMIANDCKPSIATFCTIIDAFCKEDMERRRMGIDY